MTKSKLLLLGLFFVAFALNLSFIQGQTKEKSSTFGYAGASYSGLSDNEFMINWMVLGPVKIDKSGVKPDDNKQKEAFNNDVLTNVVVQPKKNLANVKIGDSIFSWKPVKFENGIIDFNELFGQRDFAIAYALAEVKMEAPAKMLVGVGSDDGIKIFLNGTLIHNNWIGRGTNPDDDLVIMDFKKGSNQILVKVQNMEYGWSFMMRKIGKDNLGKILIESSGKGNLDNVKLAISNGVDINAKSEQGLTAYQNAMIQGREKIMACLKENGAKTDGPLPSFEKLVDNIFRSAQKGFTPGVAVLASQNGKNYL